jgi:hypothetical protein
MKPRASRYGLDLQGNSIQPKDGERILPEGSPLPERYRPWINGSGWLNVAKLHTHPGANQTAQVFGNYWAYAVPKHQPVPKVQHEEAKPSEAILGVPDVVSESTPEPILDPVPDIPAPVKKRQKRKSLLIFTNQIVFDDE